MNSNLPNGNESASESDSESKSDASSDALESKLQPEAASKYVAFESVAVEQVGPATQTDVDGAQEFENEARTETDQHAEGFQPLAPSFIKFQRRTSYVVALIVAGITIPSTSPILLTGALWALLLLVGWLILLGLLVFFSHFWPPIHYRHVSWKLGEAGFEIRRGVWWRHRISVPIARVQHVDVSQGPVQRAFGLGTLIVHTAGTKNASVELDGLEHEKALELRDELIAQKETLDVT